MKIYYIFMVSCMFLYYLYRTNRIANMNKLFCIVMGVLVFILFAFRDISLGMYDVEGNYVYLFKTLAENPFSYIFKNFTSDHLFYIFMKIITLFTSNMNVYLAINALPIVLAMGILIYRFSPYPWLSWIIFFCLGYFSVHVTLMKQSIAMALVIYMYMELAKENYKKAIVLWILAIGFHISALVSIIPVILQKWNIRIDLRTSCIFLLSSVLCFQFSDKIFDWAFSWITFERFHRYSLHLSSFNMTLFIINSVQCIFCIIIYFIQNLKKQNAKNEMKYQNDGCLYEMDSKMLLMLVCSLPFYALTNTFADIYRVGLYFSQFVIIAIPNYVKKMPLFIRGMILILLIACYFYYGAVRGLGEVTPYIAVF